MNLTPKAAENGIAGHLVTFLTALSLLAVLTVQATSSFLAMDRERYSRNTLSGVHLSRFADIREQVGTKTNANGYGDYLSSAIGEIGRERLPESGWTLEKEGPALLFGLSGTPKKLRIVPRSDATFAFGLQKATVFKLKSLLLAPSALKGRWVSLIDAQGLKVAAVVEAVSTETISVVGNIPLWFFPERIDTTNSAPVDSSRDMVVTTSLVSNVRGGRVSGLGEQGVYLYPPGWTLSLVKSPSPGDTVKLAGGESLTIKEIVSVGGGFVATLAGSGFVPHAAVRRDIVTVEHRQRPLKDPVTLLIDPVTDRSFLNGREREIKVAVESGAPPLQGGQIIGLDQGETYYVSAGGSPGELRIDLASSLVLQACRSLEDVAAKDLARAGLAEQGFPNGPERPLFRNVFRNTLSFGPGFSRSSRTGAQWSRRHRRSCSTQPQRRPSCPSRRSGCGRWTCP